MEIKLLNKDYKKNKDLYKAFVDGKIQESEEFLSDDIVNVEKIVSFPIYMGMSGAEKNIDFKEAFRSIEKNYINMDREYLMDARFWHSVLVLKNREYIINKYPEIKNSEKDFENIVLKKFDWENYIYKCILIVQYVTDLKDEVDRDKYYDIILDNLDLFNYMIKYEVFRNAEFILNILTIIDEDDIGHIMKAKIKDREDLGKDERYGRRVLFEFNKSYPIVLGPMLEKDELRKYLYKYLSYYYDLNKITK